MGSVRILPGRHGRELGFYRKSSWKSDDFKQRGMI